MKRLSCLFYGLLLLMGAMNYAFADVPRGFRRAAPEATANNCSRPQSRAELNINNVRTQIWNDGTMWWDHSGTARYEIPKNLDESAVKRNSLFAGGIWIAGVNRNNRNLQVMAMTYGQGGQVTYFAGPIDTQVVNTTRERCRAWDRIFKIEKPVIQRFAQDWAGGRIRSVQDVPEEVLFWPARGNRYLSRSPQPISEADVNFNTARFFDRDRDGIYDPLKGDFPRLPGHNDTTIRGIDNGADQSLFFVNNDVGGQKNLGSNQQIDPIGMELHTEAFSYASADARNDMTFYRNRLINKGETTMDSTYFGQWVDADLGYAFDDYVQCDVQRGLGICYNGDDFDETLLGYGTNPPSVGVDFFIGPQADEFDGIDNDKDGQVDEPEEKIIMSNFVYYNNGGGESGDPVQARDYFNYLRGRWRSAFGSRLMSYDLRLGLTPVGNTLPGLGIVQPATFMFPDTSDQRICWGQGGTVDRPCPRPALPQWNEVIAGNPPADRRFISSAGQFTLEPGASNQLTIGVVWARATSGGSRGSFGRLLINDDVAQKLFDNDFEGLNGPNEPFVSKVELDRELILTLQSDTSLTGAITESYTTRDRSLRPQNGDTAYRFQGYIVYQLADATVSTTELNNPDRARIIAQSDIQDNVATIFNDQFDPELGANSRQVMVRGANRGLQRVIRITRDAFNSEREGLVNFKKYFFRVIAYAHNNNPDNLGRNFLESTPRRDRRTGQNITIIEAIPHKVDSERGGTVIRSRFDQGLVTDRITGMGNGGNRLDSLDPAQERELVTGRLQRITYKGGNGPISVKVFNPKRVQDARFRVEVSSRIRMRRTGAYLPAVGDILVSQMDVRIPNTDTLSVTPSLDQEAGRGRVNRVLPTETPDVFDLDVSMFNDDEGGRFTKITERFIRRGTGLSFDNYAELPEVFIKEGDISAQATAIQFASADYWKLTNLANPNQAPIFNGFPISTAQEQLVPAFGISVRITDRPNPGELMEVNSLNGTQTPGIVYENPSLEWLLPVLPIEFTTFGSIQYPRFVADREEAGEPTQERANWLRVDKDARYLNYLGRQWAPYQATLVYDRETGVNSGDPRPESGARFTSGTGTPQQQYENRFASLRRLHNVDIVLTTDQSLWTRAVVLQGVPEAPNLPVTSLNKSRRPSINRDGSPSGATSPYTQQGERPSLGMGWFPGYALDLDRGIRLNMMFSENANIPTDTSIGQGQYGDDLLFQFSDGPLYSGHMVYVMDERYDEGRSLEFRADSVRARVNPVLAANYTRLYNTRVFNNAMWVGLPIKTNRAFQTTARIQLRVDRRLLSFPKAGGDTLTNPVYEFNSEGISTIRGNVNAASQALKNIRVVPNPYYAFSQYESDKVDNRVIISNIPTKCIISIYNLSGTLVRRFNIDRSAPGVNPATIDNDLTFVEWDLKNQFGLPIASGSYIVHIDAGAAGETTVKWLGILRPLDLSGLSAN